MATARSTIDGASIARIGDSITPHGRGIHGGARIVSGSFRLRVGGGRISRGGDYATCGHTISASNTTDDGSRHWAPKPPATSVQNTEAQVQGSSAEIDVGWTQGERYPGHSGTIIQWKRPGEEYDASRQHDTGFVAGHTGMLMYTITGLLPETVYNIRLVATRRFAENAAAVEITVTTTPGSP